MSSKILFPGEKPKRPLLSRENREAILGITAATSIGILAFMLVQGHNAESVAKQTLAVAGKAVSAPDANAVIGRLTHGKATVVRTFAGPDGLTGLVIRGSSGPVIGWMTNSRSAVILGGVVDAKTNENMTLQATNAYILKGGPNQSATQAPNLAPASVAPASAPVATPPAKPEDGEQALAAFVSGGVNSFHTIAQPGLSGPNTLYVFIDPNCIFCHKMYGTVQSRLADFRKAGVRVVYVPVAILKQSSIGKAAQEIQGGWTALKQDETSFNDSTEEGGLPGISGSALMQYAPFARENTDLLSTLANDNGLDGHFGTPFLVWKAGNGHVFYMNGYPGDAGLTALIGSFRSGWTPPKAK